MGKYSKDLDESLSKEVKAIANEIGLQIYGIEIETVRLKNKIFKLTSRHTATPQIFVCLVY